MNFKERLHDMRKKVNDYVMNWTNNVDKLMTEKVEDYILIEEMPLPIRIGEKTIFVGNLTLKNNFRYWHTYGKIMALIGVKFLNFDLMNDSGELYKCIMTHKKLYKELCKLIHKTICKQQAYYYNTMNKDRKELKWNNCSLGYFIKNITMEKLLQMLKLIYLFNFDAEKKNFKILLGSMAKDKDTKTIMGNYIYFWLQNLNGLTGKFQLSHLTNVDYWYNESEREITSLNPRKEDIKNAKK